MQPRTQIHDANANTNPPAAPAPQECSTMSDQVIEQGTKGEFLAEPSGNGSPLDVAAAQLRVALAKLGACEAELQAHEDKLEALGKRLSEAWKDVNDARLELRVQAGDTRNVPARH
jgi:hypothetical protein